VKVGRDGGHALDLEGERRDRVAELADEGAEDAADAGIDVEPEPAGGGELAEFGDGVDHAESVGGRGGVEADGLVINRGRHGCRVGAEVRADGHAADFEPEVVGGLIQRGMGGVGRDDAGALEAGPGCAGPLPHGGDGKEDALGAAAGEDAGSAGAAEEVGDRFEDLRFHAGEAGEDADAEAVLDEEHPEGFAEDVFEVVGGVPDVGAVAAAPPVEVAGAHGLHFGGEFGPRAAAFGHGHGAPRAGGGGGSLAGAEAAVRSRRRRRAFRVRRRRGVRGRRRGRGRQR